MTVLIAGAGPTGLTLACDLARRGVPCRVVDRAPTLFHGSRGKGLSPRTLEVFDDLGVITAVLADGMPFPRFRVYAGTRIVADRDMAEMLGAEALSRSREIPYPGVWLLPQWRTDQLLYERFIELGGEVQFGVEVTGFTQDSAGVTALTTTGPIRADYLIGCDGGRSAVRKALGVGFAGETMQSERTIIGDVRVDGLSDVRCHMFTRDGDTSERFSLWSMPGGDYYQLVATVGADQVPELTLPGMQALLRERSGRADIHLRHLRWISLYQVNVRMVDRFRVGRVLLAGDSAHVHSSAGGQGLNTSIQDAYNLGWKLAQVISGAPQELLDSYQAERMAVALHVLGLSSAYHRLNFRPPQGPAPALHQLDIGYRDSPLSVDDRAQPGRLRAGDRAPDGLLDDGTRLFDVFRGPHFTVLRVGCAELPDFGPQVRVRGVAASDGYDVAEGTLILVRPDGYIGVITPSAAVIRDWLARWTHRGH
jgi:2-polyprenyl-6-methoxyphenol hydroxylase-like FAD-dependent oxidoreductase